MPNTLQTELFTGLQHFIKDLYDNAMYGDPYWTLSLYVLIYQYNWLMFCTPCDMYYA